MSMNMREAAAGTMDGADYSDYRYQHFDYEHSSQAEADVTNRRSETFASLEPLSTAGGLDQNEVAELVAYELHATIENEPEEGGDQDVATSIEFRGTFGANLGKNGGIGSSQQGVQVDGEVIDQRESGVLARFNNTTVDDRIFQLFRADSGYPSDDQANGPGGNASPTDFYVMKKFRDLTGRGPVLDATDDITLNTTLIAGDLNSGVAGHVRVTLIWDVAEVSDAGRAFSLPDA